MNKIAKFNVTCNCWYQFIIYKDADKVCGQTGQCLQKQAASLRIVCWGCLTRTVRRKLIR